MEKRTEIGTLGEFGLIKRLAAPFAEHQGWTQLGIGDDAALLDAANQLTVSSTELLIEGVHFDLSYTPLQHLGYKTVTVAVSDIAAMNAIPTQLMVSIGLSNRFSVEAVDELYAGIKAACEDYQIDLVGGDTTASPQGFILSVTALGVVDSAQVVTRAKALPNDVS